MSALRLKQGPLVDVSDIFYFFWLGGGEGESEAPGSRGGSFFCRNPKRGEGSPRRGRGGGEGPGGCLWGTESNSVKLPDLFSRVLFSFWPPLLATALPHLFSPPFRPLLHLEKCSVV